MQSTKEIERKHIHFYDPESKRIFHIMDGSAICLMAENGDIVVNLCRYLSPRDVEIDGYKWSIQEFMRQMKLRKIMVCPLES